MRYAARAALAASFVVITAANPVPLAAQTLSPQAVEGGVSASGAPPASSSVRNLIEDAIEDFRRIPSWPNVAVLTAGGIAAMAGHSADRDVTRVMSGTEALNGVLDPGEMIGGARTQLAAALATYTIGRLSRNETATAVGADLIRAQILTQTMTAAIKMSVGRTRPDGTQYSFPSGHSSVTFATATVLQRNLGWKVGVPAYGLATYVAASRVHDKRHFLSDVTFGAALGIVAGRSVTVGRGDARFAVSPAAAPGGAAVAFTWLGSN
jgi:membrane-associated phospholipid phosphatase